MRKKNKKEKSTRMRSVIKGAILTAGLIFSYRGNVMASNVPGVGPTLNLLQAITGGLTGCVGAFATCKAVIDALAWQAATEEQKPAKKKALIQTVVIGVIGVIIGSVVTFVLGFYGG